MPLELLQQLDALVASALGVDEHDHGLHVGRGDGLDDEGSRLLLRLPTARTTSIPHAADTFRPKQAALAAK